MATKLNVVDETRSPTKTILLLAWPVLIEQIFSTLIGYADTAMVGSLGAAATASVSISMSVIMLLNGVVMSLGMGITTMVARSAGAGDYEKARSFMRHAILVILYVGLPIAGIILLLHRAIPQWMGAEPEVVELAAGYNIITGVGRIFGISSMILNSAFRGYGDTKTPLRINTTMNIVNVIFNFLLIYPTRTLNIFGLSFTMWGAGWGVNGAAVATSVGMAVAGLQGLHVAFFRDNEFRIDFKGPWKIDWVLMKQVFDISLPAMLQQFFMSASGIIITKSVATLGTVVVAARTLCDSAESIAVMPAFAFQTATTTLVGQSLGAGKPHLAEKYVKRTAIIAAIVMVFGTAGLYFGARAIIGIFTPDEAVIALSVECMHIIAFMQVPQAVGWTLTGALQGAGDTKIIFVISLITNWGIRCLGSVLAILVFGLGLPAVQCVILVQGIVQMILFFLRYRSGKWKTVLKD